MQDNNEYETKVLQRLQKVANLPSSFFDNIKLDLDYVVAVFEYLAPQINPELAWTEQMKSRKANGPANVMKTLKACNLERFLNIVAIKRVSTEHNRKKFFKVLDLIADIIENGHFPKPIFVQSQKLPSETKAQQLDLKIRGNKKEDDVPSPFQKKEKLRKEGDFREEEGILANHKDLVKMTEDPKDSENIIKETRYSLDSQLLQQHYSQDERFASNSDFKENIALNEDNERTKSAVPTPFRSSRPREIGENAPVQVISSPSRFFHDFLEKSGFERKVEQQWSIQDTTEIQDQISKNYRESHPPRRKIMTCKNELKQIKKTTSTDESRKQVGQNGKSNSSLQKNETATSYNVNDSLPSYGLSKENETETSQQEWTPKKIKQGFAPIVQTSPIVRATDPSRGVNSWMKAQNTLEEMNEEVMQIVNSIDISYQVFPLILENSTDFLPFIEGRLEAFNDSLQNFKRKLDESLQEVNQYLEKSENISHQRDIADFIKEITEEYSSPGIKSLPYLQRELDHLRQDYFQIQSQNALALLLYEDATGKKLTWSIIEENFLQYEQMECLSDSFSGSREMLLPRNLILISSKRLEKIVQKKPLYKKSAYSVFTR